MAGVGGVGLSVFAALLFASGSMLGCGTSNKPTSARCPTRGSLAPLTRELLDESLSLGTKFLLANQRGAGDFVYTYDWVAKSEGHGESPVRQAGSTWGLALIYHDEPTPEVGAALDKALAFFDGRSKTDGEGRRWVALDNGQPGSLGTVALVGLAHVDYYRAVESTLSPEERTARRDRIIEYVALVVSARRDDGLFYGKYDVDTGTPSGAASPYSDGEALLLLVKAMRYANLPELEPIVREAARAGYEQNNRAARQTNADSDITKGYYQWSSMAYFELATSGLPDVREYGDWLIELADWIIDVHRVGARARNTGYAYEGIASAYELARLREDTDHIVKLGDAIDEGLARLSSWQVGSSLANDYVRDNGPADDSAMGGVQNHACEPDLRIDVTQHQMHAVILARRYRYPQ